MPHQFPLPPAEARKHSADLSDRIRAHIDAQGGWISFAEYMNLALYTPGLGYYSAGATKIGADGDFVTAPEITPLFARCLAAQCAEVLEQLGGGAVIEVGAGTGVMAAELLLELEHEGHLPQSYQILEPSADLSARQRQTIEQRVPRLLERIQWLDAPPAAPVEGIIIGNEVIDALPVHRFAVTDDGWADVGVSTRDGELVFLPALAGPALRSELDQLEDALGRTLPAGYQSEICLALPAWIDTLAASLARGILLFIDYGLGRQQYYMPERSDGTLRCHYRHLAHDNPFIWPGLQDITAWVDFSRVAESADRAGLDIVGYTSQAQFLIAAGVDRLLAEQPLSDAKTAVTQSARLRRLLMPGDMGESFKAIALSRGEVRAPSGFGGKDFRYSL